MQFSLSSWNVNGAKKLRKFFQNHRREFVTSDVILLQETWISEESEQLVLRDYIAFHEAAVPSKGHDVMGLSSFFHLKKFSGGSLEKIPSPLRWVLPVHWKLKEGCGVIFVNILAAIYTSGCLLSDVEEFGNFIRDLRSSFGADEIIMAGDWNIDDFRRPNPVNPLERVMLNVFRDLIRDDFVRFPSTPVVTYSDGFSTLDYVIVPKSVCVSS